MKLNMRQLAAKRTFILKILHLRTILIEKELKNVTNLSNFVFNNKKMRTLFECVCDCIKCSRGVMDKALKRSNDDELVNSSLEAKLKLKSSTQSYGAAKQDTKCEYLFPSISPN